MEHFIGNMRPYLEALYFVSGIVIAIAALFALKQIHLMKLDMLSRSERAAKEKAVEAAFEFTKANELFIKYIEKFGLGVSFSYEGPIGNFTIDSIPNE